MEELLVKHFIRGTLCPLSDVCVRRFLCPFFTLIKLCYTKTLQKSVSPVLCKFWWLYGGVSDDFLQEGLCPTQVYLSQSPCGRPLLACTSSGDSQTQFCLSLCGVSGSWCAQGLFEPSERLAGKGFDSKCDFTPATILLGLLLCHSLLFSSFHSYS